MRLQHSLLVLFHFQPEADHRLSFRDLHEGKKRMRLVFKLWKWQQNKQEKIYPAFENVSKKKKERKFLNVYFAVHVIQLCRNCLWS